MSITDTIKKISEYITNVLEFLLSDKDKDGVPLVVEWAIIAVNIISKFNPLSLTDSEKQVAARILVDFGKHVTVEELERLLEIKKSGSMEMISSPLMDIVIGDVTARHITAKKIRKSGKTA